jgi:hypothetical protein
MTVALNHTADSRAGSLLTSRSRDPARESARLHRPR